MRHLRLYLPALALVVIGAAATQAMACDKAKTTATAATASHAACTPEMAANCTPEMAAACAKGAAKTTAVTAAKTASMDCCAMKSTKTASATTAAKKSATVVASSGACTGMTGATVAAGHGASSGKVTAVAAGSGGECSSHGSTSALRMSEAECDACADQLMCSGELETAGTRTQVVPLKNGVMFVYTAEEPGKVNAVQSAMARRSARLNQIVTAGDRARLCPECKAMRGAIASGKMTREVINIEGGALTLMTSSDPVMVKKIRAMVDGTKIARAKS